MIEEQEGVKYYLAYSTDTTYRNEVYQRRREDSNYYSTLRYRQRLVDDFDWDYYYKTFGNYTGKVRGVW